MRPFATMLGAVSALLVSSCSTPPAEITGDWIIPGVGYVSLDGYRATSIMPKGGCGGFSHCSRLTSVTEYQVRRDGDSYIIDFASQSLVSGTRDEIQLSSVENEPNDNRYGTLRLKKQDDCTFIEKATGSSMRSLSPSCPALPLGADPAERVFDITLQEAPKSEYGIYRASRYPGVGHDRNNSDELDPINIPISTVTPIGKASITMVNQSKEYDLPVGVPIRVMGRHSDRYVEDSGRSTLVITGFMSPEHPGKIIRRFEVANQISKWQIKTYQDGTEDIVVEHEGGGAWDETECQVISLLGIEEPVKNGDTRIISAVRRVPNSPKGPVYQHSVNSPSCEPVGNSNEDEQGESSWWVIYDDRSEALLIDQRNILVHRDGASAPWRVTAPLAMRRTFDDRGTVTEVVCGTRFRPNHREAKEPFPRSSQMTENIREHEDLIRAIVCGSRKIGEWGAVPLLVPLDRYLAYRGQHLEADAQQVMYSLAWGQPLPSDDPLYTGS